MRASQDLATELVHLRDAVAAARFDLAVETAAAARHEQAALLRQVDDYLLPRLRSLDAPLLAVVGGSTGAGKSTLVNSVVGEVVTTSGVLRPTTRAPVLACHPDDRRWFADDRVLPGLARTTGEPGGPGTVHLVETTGLPAGLALLDAPDIDSVVAANRDLAAQLLAAADLWVFVTTAARYADAVPWDLLTTAARRRAAVAVVLDRVPPEAVTEVAADLRRLLDEHDLGASPVHVVRETALDGGRLPEAEVGEVRAWLRSLAADADARAEVIRATLEGALGDLERRGEDLVTAAAEQRRAGDELLARVTDAYGQARRQVGDDVSSGTLLRGEVLDRWQELVGTGELMRSLQARIGGFRDRVVATVTGRSTAPEAVQEAVESGVEALVRAAADRAADATVVAWRQSPAGRALLGERHPDLTRASVGLVERLPDDVRAWQGDVLELVRQQGAERRTSARIASYTVNGAGLAVMLGVFSQTGGLTGAEVAVAGGTSAASQKVIEAIFGDQAVRSLAKQAREDLLARVDLLLAGEEDRFTTLVDATGAGEARVLTEALARWRAARHGARRA
jgi:hypothetical protein